MVLRRVLTVFVCLFVAGALAAPPAQAHRRKKPARKPVLRVIEVHTHYTEPQPTLDGVECRGLSSTPPNPDCGMHYLGTATFTGTMYGDVWFDMYTMWQPNGHLAYEGPDYVNGGVEGCGKGSFVIEDTEGYIDFTKYDRETNSAPGFNKWHLRKGSGTGELVNLVDGEGVNHWREYFDGATDSSVRAGEGDFTGWISCYR